MKTTMSVSLNMFWNVVYIILTPTYTVTLSSVYLLYLTCDPVCTDNEGNPRAPGEVWNGSARSCCLYKCMENGSVVAVEPDCSSVPTPLCEREGEYVLDVLEEGACCPKKICGEFKSKHLWQTNHLVQI